MSNKERIEQENSQAQRLNTTSDTKIGLVDIDFAIQKYIEKHIAKTFVDTTTKNHISVDVLMKRPERWIDQKDLKRKDITGNHSTFPLIGIARNGVDILKHKVPHWLRDEDLSYIIDNKSEFSYDKESRKYYKMVRRPAYIDANYEFEIVSGLERHTNHLTEQFIYHEGKYWSDGESYSFRTSFQSISDASIGADQGQERIIISSISALCKGFILPEYVEMEKVSMKFVPANPKIQMAEKIISIDSIKNKSTSIWD